MIAEGFTCQRYGFNVGADKFSLLTIENGKTSIMRLSEWTLISQSQKSHSDRLLEAIKNNQLSIGLRKHNLTEVMNATINQDESDNKEIDI